MYVCKLTLLLLTIMITLAVYRECNVEGLTEDPTNIIDDRCKDSADWFVEDRSGKKHYCIDIGKSVNCYNMNSVGRDGWSSCAKSCGNCAKTTVTKMPMNMLATFSGDPIDDFGVVLDMDKERDWVGKQDKSGKDVRGTIDKDVTDDISNIMDRLSSAEDIFDLITGSTRKCVQPQGKCKPTEFAGCDKQCVNCPSIPTPTERHAYIKQVCDRGDSCSSQFPAITMTCADVTQAITTKDCKRYLLFDKLTDKDPKDAKDVSTKDISTKDKNKVSLYDMCPYQCTKYSGPTICMPTSMQSTKPKPPPIPPPKPKN